MSRNSSSRASALSSVAAVAAALVVMAILMQIIKTGSEEVEGFSLIFLSIVLEAIPFVMIGAFISSIIQFFISEQTISRIIPKSRLAGLAFASLAGFVFPVCECAIVPIARRLIKKGVPIPIAVTFMLAVPIVNPVVLASTYYAFSSQVHMVFLRAGIGVTIAMTAGFLMGILQGPFDAAKAGEESSRSCSCGCSGYGSNLKGGMLSRLVSVIEHTSIELFEVGRFLILGAFLSSLMQTFLSRKVIYSIGQGRFSSILVMLVLAFVLSLCSEADAFIARTFLGQFTTGSIIGFLVLGPMIDIKNTLMLSQGFKKGFVAKLTALIFILCFLTALAVNIIGL